MPTIFVEQSRNGKPSKPRAALLVAPQENCEAPILSPVLPVTVEKNQLKPPGVVSKARGLGRNAPAHAPLPTSLMYRHAEDMDKIASDMNQWVLNELGANLHHMEQVKQQVKKPRFQPKAPAQRYVERHPESVPVSEPQDIVMGDASEDESDDDDWVIEEFVRIPANSVALDVSPSEIGVLVLDDDDETLLFFGSLQEDDDDDEDDEDENGRFILSAEAEYYSQQGLACMPSTLTCAQPRVTTQQTIQRTRLSRTTSTVVWHTATATALRRTTRSLTIACAPKGRTTARCSRAATAMMTMTRPEWPASGPLCSATRLSDE